MLVSRYHPFFWLLNSQLILSSFTKSAIRSLSPCLVKKTSILFETPPAFPIIAIGLIVVIYTQNFKIKHLESRIKTLLKSNQSSENERLVYLRKNLSHLGKIKAIKALRVRYPELSLVEAYELWEQSRR